MSWLTAAVLALSLGQAPPDKPAKPALNPVPFNGAVTPAPAVDPTVRLTAGEFELIQLTGYTGKATWRVIPKVDAPVKLFHVAPKTIILGTRVGQKLPAPYEVPVGGPTAAAYPVATGPAQIEVWGVDADGSPVLLAEKMIEANLGPRPPPTVAVPNLFGMTQASAEAAVVSTGLAVGTMSREAGAATTGTVVRQLPLAGSQVVAKTAVAFVLSSGVDPPPPVPTSDVTKFVADNIKALVAMEPLIRKKRCGEIAAVYRRIADDIELGKLAGAKVIFKATDEALQVATKDDNDAWVAFGDALADKLLNKLRDEGKLKTDAAHARVWRELAAGYEVIANG